MYIFLVTFEALVPWRLYSLLRSLLWKGFLEKEQPAPWSTVTLALEKSMQLIATVYDYFQPPPNLSPQPLTVLFGLGGHTFCVYIYISVCLLLRCMQCVTVLFILDRPGMFLQHILLVHFQNITQTDLFWPLMKRI